MWKVIKHFFVLTLFAVLPFHAYADDKATINALEKKDFKFLNNYLNEIQTKFEAGKVTEIELRNAFRPFYKLNQAQENALREWVAAYPKSYASRLALGIFIKKKAWEIRGDKYISKTPQKNIDEMEKLFTQSRAELISSLYLTKKPYLSVFHLLDIAKGRGDDEDAQKLHLEANKMLPNNRLVRARYFATLEPRWGGSYKLMEEYINSAKKEGVDQIGIWQLEAIKFNDQGLTAWENKNYVAAHSDFLAALNRAKRIGGTFREDYLHQAEEFVCKLSHQPEYCK
ncbi:hypothetical protein NH8B_1978 [Pseudogulbenkiania sp. NH8B]|uniref:DUF4034 domain-containing protein n=1 Tax=Pseudogulbenkiania sp. (strain NH8B) TaxID=748280 RepID=UPI00022798D1|nr:DUF4034 domain-containing protein [Pseudogulbenkiania sp. NH8B]BAK76793.1 hypothetical protein NH8B_1978 [Pseudogulbenkiania sp. NH8B]